MAGQEACRAGTVALVDRGWPETIQAGPPPSREPVVRRWAVLRALAGCWCLGRDHAQQDWALFPVVLRVVDVLS